MSKADKVLEEFLEELHDNFEGKDDQDWVNHNNKTRESTKQQMLQDVLAILDEVIGEDASTDIDQSTIAVGGYRSIRKDDWNHIRNSLRQTIREEATKRLGEYYG